MADRPILFSAPMVRALLEGEKTQTRRVLKSQPLFDAADNCIGQAFASAIDPGDRLWVKESWSHIGHGVWTISDARMVGRGGVIYRAGHGEQDGSGPRVDAKWWPSIHMPREFSRLTLLVTDVRVQRLQDIGDDDVLAEGAPVDPFHRDGTIDGSNPVMCMGPTPHHRQSPRAWFHRLWNSLHGPDAWDANPWVAAISFEVVRANIDKVQP